MIRLLRIAALAAFVLAELCCGQARAQKTTAQLLTEISANLPSGNPSVLTAASLRSTLNDIVSATSYMQTTAVAVSGLACDGVTDDSAVFQAALNALTAPATAALPRGTCVLHGITIPTGVSIRGTSTDGTVVSPTSNSQTVFSQSFGVLTQAATGIESLTIDCKGFTGATGISFTLAKEVQIRGVDVAGCATAIVLDRGYDYKISNISTRGNGSQGAGQIKAWSSSDADYIFNVSLSNITTLNVGNGVQADAVYFRRVVNSYLSNYGANDLSTGGTPRNGLVIENDSQGVFISNFIAAAPATGILQQTGSGVAVAPSFTTITNFGVDQASTHGITISSGTYSIFSNGNVAASGVATGISAISVGGGSFNTIQGVTVNGYSGATGAAVDFTASVADWSLFNNRWDSNHFCIKIAGTNTDFRVANNTCTNKTTDVSGAAAGGGNMFSNNLGIAFQANTPAVYQESVHGLTFVFAGGSSYDGGFFGRGGNELFANISSTNDLRLVGDPAAAANQGHLRTGSFPPSSGTPTGCGTGSPTVIGSDTSGLITLGTNATTCTLTFAVAHTSAPYCVVTWQSNLALMQYTVTNTAITLAQTSATGNKVNYVCIAQSGG